MFRALPARHQCRGFTRNLMKIRYYENLGRRMRDYHRSHPWRLSEGGLYIPHAYTNMAPDALSWWDDVGFILNGRRFIVWWLHPRQVYADAVQEQAWQEACEGPGDDWLIDGASKNYRLLGKSGKRKKIVSYTCRSPSVQQREHYDRLRQIEDRLTGEGIALDVTASWKWQRLRWAMGVSLVAPLEVRNARELTEVAHLARSLVLQQTTLQAQFSGYVYSRADWLRDQAKLAEKRAAHERSHGHGAKPIAENP